MARFFQYQAKTEPVTVPLVLTFIVSAAVTAQVIFPRSIIYQSIAQPVPITEETVTLDKWFEPLSEPKRVRVSIAPNPPYVTTVEQEVLASADASVGVSFKRQWQYQAKVEPVFIAEPELFVPSGISTDLKLNYKWQYQAKAEPVFVTGETVTLDKWVGPLSEPIRRKPFINQQDNNPPLFAATDPNQFAYAPSVANTTVKFKRVQQYQAKAEPTPVLGETITLDKWFEPLSEPTKRKPFINQQDNNPQLFAVTNPANTVYAPSGGAVSLKFKRPWQYQIRSDVAFVPTPETITVDKWFEPWSEPTRIKTRIGPLPVFVFVPDVETITVDKWYEPLSEPKRVKIRQAPYPAYVPVVEAITVDKWFRPLAEPSRVKVRQAPYPAYVPVVETVTIDKWLQQLSDPKRPIKGRIGPQDTFVPVVTPETITVDKWFEHLSEPKRFRGRIYQPTAYCPQEIAAPVYVWAPLVEGATGVRFQKTIVYQPIAETPLAPPVVVTYYPFVGGDTGLTLQKTIVYQDLAQALSPEQTLFWGRTWSEPIRVKPRVPQYQTLAWGGFTPAAQPPVTEESKWHQAWSEPVRIKRLATAHRQALAWGFTTPAITSAIEPTTTSSAVNFPRSIIYQSIAWTPIPIAAPPAVIFYPFVEGDTGVIFRKKVIYQSIAEAASIEVNTFWFEPLSEPVRQPLGLKRYLQSATTWSRFVSVPVPTTINAAETGQVVFPRSFIYQSKAWSPLLIIPETITEDKWHQALSEPVRMRRFPTAEQQVLAWSGFTPAPTPPVITLDYVEGDTGLIFRKKIIYQSFADAASPETHVFWFGPLTEPVRDKPGLKRHLYQASSWNPRFIPPEVVTEDKWHYPWSLPVKLKKQFGAELQQAFTTAPAFPNFVRSIAWYAPLSEPVRQKIGLGSRYQSFWTFGREVIVPPVILTLDATETNNDTAFFSISVLYNRPVRAWVSIKEIKRHDDAYVSIEET